MIQNSHTSRVSSLKYDTHCRQRAVLAISPQTPQRLPGMSWSSTDDALFAAHLQHTLAAVESAMHLERFDALVIQAGDNRLVFQDDQAYPFRINPWFTWLVPALPAPGSLLELRT